MPHARSPRLSAAAGVVIAATTVAACFDDGGSTFNGGSDAGADGAGPGGDGACPILSSTLDVFVKDAANGIDVCDATVVASSSAATVTLTKQETSPVYCSYQASSPPPAGTYTVQVTAPDYAPASQSGVVVSVDSCGNVEAPTLTIQITAQPLDAGAGG